MIAVTVGNAAQAIGLVRRGCGLTALSARQVTVDAWQSEIPVGIDGETVMMPTPVRCTILPRVLTVVVPRPRPGVPAPRRDFTWCRLGHLAAFGAAAAK